MDIRHKIEKKELQAQIMQLKKSVPKGDKKKLKEVNQEIAKLQTDMAHRHKVELELAAAGKTEAEIMEAIANGMAEEMAKMTVTPAADEGTPASSAAANGEAGGAGGDEGLDGEQPHHKVSKAAKRREKKELEAKARRAQSEHEVAHMPNHRGVEESAFKKVLDPLDLEIHQIPADGNCLFAAVAHQLHEHAWLPRGKVEDVLSLRTLAASHIRQHADDYLPFMLNDNGDMLSPDEFDLYVQRLKNSNDWGGQVELRALSEALQARIVVYQSNTRPQELAGRLAPDDRPIRLSYHRHAYGLGEHYNSVVPRGRHRPTDDDE